MDLAGVVNYHIPAPPLNPSYILIFSTLRKGIAACLNIGDICRLKCICVMSRKMAAIDDVLEVITKTGFSVSQFCSFSEKMNKVNGVLPHLFGRPKQKNGIMSFACGSFVASEV